jgi:hypothetical protein
MKPSEQLPTLDFVSSLSWAPRHFGTIFSGGIMEQLPERIQKITHEFTGNIRECFGPDVLSVVLYGPATRDELIKGSTSINFMVVVRDNTPSELAPCSVFMKKWAGNGIATPLFITPEYIRDSLDSFPLEFMEMKSSYRVLDGEDYLKDLEFRDSDVRNECEREFKGKLLHLRAEYLALRGNRNGIAGLVVRSLNSFRLVFSGALFLKRCAVPAQTLELLETVAHEYNLDMKFLREIHSLAVGLTKPTPAETDRLFDRYVEQLDKLSHAIDTFCIPEE